ncbi:hypothetical protein QCA50_011973 [Cerrena zonata]|uniref:Association with the SNF1 complex (ASC) domain-containing protein n=1 Tax=Cerrena zonata TaxID=2478898 RepID=A0AAW0G562_9APHY
MSASPTSTDATKDVSMVDVSSANAGGDGNGTFNDQPPQRRRSTIILTDDNENESMNVDEKNDDGMVVDKSPQDEVEKLKQQKEESDQSQQSQSQSQTQNQNQNQNQTQNSPLPDANTTIPVDIKWVQGGEKVYVTGSFTGWRKMISLAKQTDDSFSITLGLPVGTHRFRFVVDNELRFSDFLPTATDQMGNFVNYAEVTPDHVQAHMKQQEEKEQQERREQEEHEIQQQQSQQSRLRASSMSRHRLDSAWGLTNDDDDMGGGYSRYHDEEDNSELSQRKFNYINDIPPIFTDPKVMEQYYMAIDKQSKQQSGQQQAWLHPPQLPPHLENVILNNFNSADKDNNLGALPIPNHVVLNHLATTSIKHNTLAVALVVRYKRKYVTQVLYAPLKPQQ